jgi:hypothetical protein
MSDLEAQNKPQISAMMHGKGIVLDPMQQKLFTRWAILKAMVVEGSNRERPSFYDEFERKSLKPLASALPVRTSVWVGLFAGEGLHAGGTDVWGEIDNVARALHGCVTTIVVGHLAVQVLTIHVLPTFATRVFNLETLPGKWDAQLLNVWPVFGSIRWPPRISFAVKGPDSIGRLVYRFNTGEDVS